MQLDGGEGGTLQHPAALEGGEGERKRHLTIIRCNSSSVPSRASSSSDLFKGAPALVILSESPSNIYCSILLLSLSRTSARTSAYSVGVVVVLVLHS